MYTFVERKIKVDPDGAFPIGATVTMPQSGGKAPAVVMVQGSGPQDRDESVAMNKPFRDIARSLAERGIASIRYDKRTYSYPERMKAMLGELTVFEEVIDDTIKCAEYLSDLPDIDADKIYLLGHSLGGMLAPRIDEHYRGAHGKSFAGLIIMAGSPRRLAEIIRDQNLASLDDLPENIRESAKKQIDAMLDMFDAFADMPDEDVKNIDIGGASGYYIKELDAKTAADYLQGYNKPIMILQGAEDFQISPEKDFEPYKAILEGRDNAKFKLYEGLNHLFMPSIKGTIEDYETPGSVDTVVINDIAAWIESI